MIVLTDLFNLDFPLNADMIMQMILKLCAMELKYFKLESFFENFNFRETEPFRTQTYANGEEYSKFADAGYESSNFFLLLGPLLLVIPTFLIFSVCKKLLQFILGICSKTKIIKVLAKYVSAPTDFQLFFSRFLLEACLEIGLSAVITVIMRDEKNFN